MWVEAAREFLQNKSDQGRCVIKRQFLPLSQSQLFRQIGLTVYLLNQIIFFEYFPLLLLPNQILKYLFNLGGNQSTYASTFSFLEPIPECTSDHQAMTTDEEDDADDDFDPSTLGELTYVAYQAEKTVTNGMTFQRLLGKEEQTMALLIFFIYNSMYCRTGHFRGHIFADFADLNKTAKISCQRTRFVRFDY